ncbi:hypothetical protein EOD42_16670 [Rhodovarius crocodyli]|uniref:Uncharacterized protein n=1 Tax=Rhodovarius crocodyli TaxID=1979269 RepID=A0A437MC61_9PROT|nr:hypothetical protein [Rhodovarius crocodyli]RVT95218.1 hypothetical protein EOD42_16670 [Rhodovarius crocodyli]
MTADEQVALLEKALRRVVDDAWPRPNGNSFRVHGEAMEGARLALVQLDVARASAKQEAPHG